MAQGTGMSQALLNSLLGAGLGHGDLYFRAQAEMMQRGLELQLAQLQLKARTCSWCGSVDSLEPHGRSCRQCGGPAHD